MESKMLEGVVENLLNAGTIVSPIFSLFYFLIREDVRNGICFMSMFLLFSFLLAIFKANKKMKGGQNEN